MDEAFLNAAAASLGMTIPDECRSGVLRYLALVATLAPKVMDFPLTPADESGNVFTPVEPRG